MTPEQRAAIQSLIDSGLSLNRIQKELSKSGLGMNRQRLEGYVRELKGGVQKDTTKLPGGAAGGRKRKPSIAPTTPARKIARDRFAEAILSTVGIIEGDFGALASLTSRAYNDFLFSIPDVAEARQYIEHWHEAVNPDFPGEFDGSGGFDGSIGVYFADSEGDAEDQAFRVFSSSGGGPVWNVSIRIGSDGWQVDLAAAALAIITAMVSLSSDARRNSLLNRAQLIADQALSILSEG